MKDFEEEIRGFVKSELIKETLEENMKKLEEQKREYRQETERVNKEIDTKIEMLEEAIRITKDCVKTICIVGNVGIIIILVLSFMD